MKKLGNNAPYLFLILLPIIDLFTSLMRRFFSIDISFGIIFKGLVALVLLLYLLFFIKGNIKKKIMPLLTIGLYVLFYIIFKLPLISESNNLVVELISLFRFLFYPLLFYLLYRLIDQDSIDGCKLNKSFILSLLLYIIIFTLSQITKTSFNSYIGDNLGGVGWYYAANEISVILVMLFPFIYYLLKYKNKLFFYFIGSTAAFFISMIGTKVSSFGILIITILFIILPLIFKSQKDKYPFKHTLLLFILTFFIIFGSPSMFNLKTASDRATVEYEKKIQEQIAAGEETIEFGNEYLDKAKSILLSGRNIFLIDTINIYKDNQSINTFLFGLGISNSSIINNPKISKWIEMDFFDIFFHYGLIGLLIILSPLIFTIYLTIKKKILFKKLKFDNTLYILVIGLVLFISFISGHVIAAPAVSIYLIIYQLLYLQSINGLRKEKKVNLNKVSILSLHLGHGGIEQANVNLANMLSSKYDVELVSLYKTVDVIPYQLNDSVKLVYLSNLKPNKKDFKEVLKNKALFKVILEGFKAVKILLMKRYLVAKFIINSDAKYIISSRIEFTKQLSLYGSNKIVKIAQEHRHHNNDERYIKSLKNALHNIDYLLPVSKELTNYYKKRFKNIKDLKILFIRHALAYYPEYVNGHNGKKIISVGRLSYEKGYDDLIEIFNEVLKIDNNYSLTICGLGDQEENIKNKINDYGLKDKVIMTGFINQEELHKEYDNSTIFVLASRSEAFGLVYLEAMSFGLPCLTFSSAQGAKEIINGHNGLIIKNRDNILLAKELVNIVNNKKLYDKMSNQARKTALNYKLDKVEEYWINFIERA